MVTKHAPAVGGGWWGAGPPEVALQALGAKVAPESTHSDFKSPGHHFHDAGGFMAPCPLWHHACLVL